MRIAIRPIARSLDRSHPLRVKAEINKVVVVGGVAGGASFAARLRRLSESCDITLIEKGPSVSFANCGLPYAVRGGRAAHDMMASFSSCPSQVSNVIDDEAKLLVSNAAKFKAWFNVNVRLLRSQ